MSKFLIALMFLTTTARAEVYFPQQDIHLLEPTDVHIDAYKYEDYRNSYIAPDDQYVEDGATFTTNLHLVRWNHTWLDWKNDLFFDQSSKTGQIVHAGWKYELSLVPWYDRCPIAIFRQHQSEHVLDEARPGEHFPVYDRYGIRLQVWP